jgi:hypothetical protein
MIMIVNLEVAQIAGNFLTSCVTLSFPTRSLLHNDMQARYMCEYLTFAAKLVVANFYDPEV